jgi:hypothetical protein
VEIRIREAGSWNRNRNAKSPIRLLQPSPNDAGLLTPAKPRRAYLVDRLIEFHYVGTAARS